ncbi:MAG: hypothetical protein PHD39_13910 [Methylobacter tundripaludum]|nr:hypothetical protein [Methylobacter tundripaludum]
MRTHNKHVLMCTGPRCSGNNDDCMDAGGTTPRMEEVEQCMEQLPRATQGAVADDCMDAGGRATQEQLPSKQSN